MKKIEVEKLERVTYKPSFFSWFGVKGTEVTEVLTFKDAALYEDVANYDGDRWERNRTYSYPCYVLRFGINNPPGYRIASNPALISNHNITYDQDRIAGTAMASDLDWHWSMIISKTMRAYETANAAIIKSPKQIKLLESFTYTKREERK
jgi:hypothetical protein